MSAPYRIGQGRTPRKPMTLVRFMRQMDDAPNQRTILRSLIVDYRFKRETSVDILYAKLYLNNPPPRIKSMYVGSDIVRLRKKIAPLGWAIVRGKRRHFKLARLP